VNIIIMFIIIIIFFLSAFLTNLQYMPLHILAEPNNHRLFAGRLDDI